MAELQVGGVEEFPREVDQLAVGRMIERLDADDLLLDLRRVRVEVAKQLELGRAGPAIRISPASFTASVTLSK